jgi:hypothetical protein
MTNYFISQSSGRIEQDKKITWRFPEFDMDIPVRVCRVEKDRHVSFKWDNEGTELLVEINLVPYKTIVRL